MVERDPYTGYPINTGSTYYTERLAKWVMVRYLAKLFAGIAYVVLMVVGFIVCCYIGDPQAFVYYWAGVVVLSAIAAFVLLVIAGVQACSRRH